MKKEKLSESGKSRRGFLGKLGGATAASIAIGAVGGSTSVAQSEKTAQPVEVGSANLFQRAHRAFTIRVNAALANFKRRPQRHPTNGDEGRYPNQIGSFSKALPHDSLGIVTPGAYTAMVHAMTTGQPSDFALIPMGGTVKLANPQAALAFTLEGADSHFFGIPAPPAFASEAEAGEMAEVYWQALTRDVPFSQYSTDPTIAQSVTDLNRYSNFVGTTAANIFRGPTPGDLVGPYISQFLFKPFPYGAHTIAQQYRVPLPNIDFMTNYSEWLNIQNGVPPSSSITFDPTLRYIRNGRDLGEYVHRDFSYQAFLNAALILLGFGGAALSSTNPYLSSLNQGAFVQFGGPHVLDLVARAALEGLKAAWCQKWSIHRRLRPEEFGGRVHNHVTGAASYPIHTKLLTSSVLGAVNSRFGTYLLPMAFAEGCPTHPAYPAGHATIAGACTTILKAFFKESFVTPNPVVASDDGLSLNLYSGPTLTVGNELNKLASNISIGRDTAGVHWRSDGVDGMNLGEAVAISILRDYRETYNETFGGFTFTKFNGSTITI